MTELDRHFAKMWQEYCQINPDANVIRSLFSQDGSKVLNDHIALRTYGHKSIDIEVLGRMFLKNGYHVAGSYGFEKKHLNARHFEHEIPTLPKIFISALDLTKLSTTAKAIVENLIQQIPASLSEQEDFCYSGRPWQLSFSGYETLLRESEYAAWLAAFGFRPNHFTLSVNHLKTINSIEEVNQLLKQNGFRLNTSGGEIKGTPEDLLEQSSTLARPVTVDFIDGEQSVPGCYYEFARRYPDKTGKLFQGFVAGSADKIFESTDVKVARPAH